MEKNISIRYEIYVHSSKFSLNSQTYTKGRLTSNFADCKQRWDTTQDGMEHGEGMERDRTAYKM